MAVTKERQTRLTRPRDVVDFPFQKSAAHKDHLYDFEGSLALVVSLEVPCFGCLDRGRRVYRSFYTWVSGRFTSKRKPHVKRIPFPTRLCPMILHNVASLRNSTAPVTVSSRPVRTSGNMSFESADGGGTARRGTNQFAKVCARPRQLSLCGFLHLFVARPPAGIAASEQRAILQSFAWQPTSPSFLLPSRLWTPVDLASPFRIPVKWSAKLSRHPSLYLRQGELQSAEAGSG